MGPINESSGYRWKRRQKMLGFTEFQIIDLLCKIMVFDKRGDIRPSDNIDRSTLYMNNEDVTV